MKDIINRLRGIYEIGPDGEFGTRDFSDFIPPINLEAANYIVLLEKKIYNMRCCENCAVKHNALSTNINTMDCDTCSSDYDNWMPIN